MAQLMIGFPNNDDASLSKRVLRGEGWEGGGRCNRHRIKFEKVKKGHSLCVLGKDATIDIV